MRKTRIKVKANIIVHGDACEVARFTVDDQHNKTIDITDSNNEINTDSTNVNLVEFGVYTKTLLANSIQKTRRKQTVEIILIITLSILLHH